MSKGFIYIATNRKGSSIDFVKEAIFSANSLKKIHPESHITLFTDKEIIKDKDCPFDNIIIVELNIRSKQDVLQNTPYEKTIFIDTDTYINGNIKELFDMLDKFECIACHDCYSKKRVFNIPEYMNIPTAFNEINSGVFGFKKCENFNKMINLWNHYYHKYKEITNEQDQPSCRIACWESNIKLYILPLEYNTRSKGVKCKVLNYIKKGDPRFNKNHFNTNIFHWHGLDKLRSVNEMNNQANVL